MNTLSTPDILTLAAQAQEAAYRNDLPLLRNLLYPIWEDTEHAPDFSDYSDLGKAELSRLVGIYLSQAGQAENTVGYQLRAKDLFTFAAELFEILDIPDQSADAKVRLANCYLYCGEDAEFNDILCSIVEDLEPAHPASIKIRVHKAVALNLKQDHEGAYQILRGIYPIIDQCVNVKTQIQFHQTAGIVMHDRHRSAKSISHFNKARQLSESIHDDHSLGLAINMLAMAHAQIKDFDTAHRFASQAFETLSPGWQSYILDTEALIYLAEKNVAKTLETADKAITSFSQGENYRGWADALFTKIRGELRSDKTSAYKTLEILDAHALKYLTEKDMTRYIQDFQKEVEIVAAEALKEASRIKRVARPGAPLYLFPAVVMALFGIEADCLVSIILMSYLAPNTVLLFEHETELKLGRLAYNNDMDLNLSMIDIGGDDFLLFEDVRVLGVPVGYCRLDGAREKLEFQKF